MPVRDLKYFIAEYANVYLRTAICFVDDLTYGNRGIKMPDPATQPIIKLNETLIAITPYLILGNSLERNFAVLLNKLPEEKNIYLKLVQEKENIMRENIKDSLRVYSYRYFHGKIPVSEKLPDIDLAIISDKEKTVQILELKWFIAPAEVREVIEKGQEIRKGVSQLVILSKALHANPKAFYNVLSIDETYHVYFIVISENFIGEEGDQIPEIPVIQIDHYLRKANDVKDFERFSDWLSDRQFLPVEGRDFKVNSVISTIDKWNLSMAWD